MGRGIDNLALREAQLFQNFPNPFGNTTIIKYYIPENVSAAHLKIYTTTGQEVYDNKILQRGEGSVEISNNAFAPGAYIYNLVIDGVVADFKKMVLER